MVPASQNTQAGSLVHGRIVRDNKRAHFPSMRRYLCPRPRSLPFFAATIRLAGPACRWTGRAAADAPALPAGFVPRPKLVGRLTGHPEAVLILIVAPPGYGKSTLLAEWADADERPFVWLGPVSAGGLCDPADVRAALGAADAGATRATCSR